jgi:hypothetical protein
MKAQKMNTLRNAKIAVASMGLLATLALVPEMVKSYTIWEWDHDIGGFNVTSFTREYASTELYSAWYNTVFVAAIYDVIPMFFIIIPFNAAVIRSIRQMKKRQDSLESSRASSRRRGPGSSTVLVITMVVVFIALRLPGCFAFMMTSVRKIYPHFLRFVNVDNFREVTNFLIDLNSAINFLIYVSVGRSFRERLRGMCVQCRGKSLGVLGRSTSIEEGTDFTMTSGVVSSRF